MLSLFNICCSTVAFQSYVCVVKLGEQRDTDDASGLVIQQMGYGMHVG